MIFLLSLIKQLFSNTATLKYVLLFGALIGIFGYFWYQNHKIKSLEDEVTKKELTISTQRDTIDSISKSVEKIKKINNDLNKTNNEIIKNQAVVSNRLNELSEEAKKDPNNVEIQINKESILYAECFMRVTGANYEKNEICPYAN